ncbi:MAG: AraC family transcriptional regulator, partial [Chloroflexota bacterium]
SGEIKHVDIHLDASMLRRFIQKENSLSYLVTINSSKHLKPLLDYLVDECKDRSRTDSHVLTIINTLILEFFLVGHRIDEKTHKEWMENLRQFVLENLEKKISITDLADVVGMSRREFNYNFKAANKQTPYGWIIQQRMIHAKKLLINDTPFAEVSGLTGFTDQSHFNRVFKKMNGCTPTDWKIRASTEILRRKVQDCS